MAPATRSHRELAIAACAILPGIEAERWIEDGWHDPILSQIAQAIADAEVRGRAAERADVVAWLRSEVAELDAQGQGAHTANAYGWAFERGEHVGASAAPAKPEQS